MDLDISSELEYDHHHPHDDQQANDEADSSTKRSYECMFCKRGFTNAQALGGHMNIHRKDRAKSKQIPGSSSFDPIKLNYEQSDLSSRTSQFYAPNISSETTRPYFPVLDQSQRNYHIFLQASGSSSIAPHACSHDSNDCNFVSRSQGLNTNQELLSANLSLRVGSTGLEDVEVRRGVWRDDEVDLELRLGHDP